MKVDLRDRSTWTLLAFGGPALLAAAVVVWGYFATVNEAVIPDPAASPLVAIEPNGNAVPIAPTRPPATPTPGLGPGMAYRLEGIIVDEVGVPLVDVCIAIGPVGCGQHSPRTDRRGVYFIDFPQADVAYDLHFTKVGHQAVTRRLKLTQNLVLNLVLPQELP